ncbi:MAG: LLM class flavin-dependent oxidoreductase [Alphaproteobacteria bacterium]|nr:LLM class flavin-dependent oxidoreductase [Alphaproteobacteria bacterium]
MPIEFTHVSGKTAGESFFHDFVETATGLSLIEDAGFRKLIVDDPAGLLTNMDIAARALDRTASLEVVLTHWSGVLEPTVAARQLAALDRRGAGRLSLRMLSEPPEDSDAEARPVGHGVAWQRIDEYLVLLKRLWSNDRPIDHEGAFYSVRGGYVPRKGPQGADLTIRLGGQSGTALKVAGKHADVFELAAGSPEEVKQLIERVRRAAAEHGRGGRLRFALPVRIHADGWSGTPDPKAVGIAGPPARIALALLPYAALGIGEFMIGGIDRPSEIARVGREIVTLVANSLARREAEMPRPGALAARLPLTARSPL